MTQHHVWKAMPGKFSAKAGLIGILLLVGWQGLAANAAVRYVTEAGVDQGNCMEPATPCATLSYAVSQAKGGDDIQIGAGIFTEPDGVFIDMPLTVLGEGREDTIVQAHDAPAMATNRVFHFEGGFSAHIEGMTIRHGMATGPAADSAGGGLLAVDSNLFVRDVVFRNNSTPTIGGGAALMGADGEFEDVLFESNSSGTFGGGLLLGGSNSQFTQVVFRDNQAGQDGGGLAASVSFLKLDDVTFEANGADGFGGGLFAWFDTSGELSEVQFLENEAPWGGGLFLDQTVGDFVIDDSLFQGNISTWNGGGLYTAASPEIVNSQFVDNASLHGGGLMSDGGSVLLDQVAFVGNFASGLAGTGGRGGGLYATAAATVTLHDVLFQDNNAIAGARMGGGMLVENAVASLTEVEFFENSALNGAGLHVFNGNATINGAVFEGNHAEQRGGGMSNMLGSTTVTNAGFINNQAGDVGGGMFNSNSGPVLTNVEFQGNTAGSGGGGMANTSSAAPVLFDVTFSGNHSQGAGVSDGGGGLRNLAGSTTTLNRTTFSGNSSNRNGGAVFNQTGVLLMEEVGFLNNQANDGFGGAIFATDTGGMDPTIDGGNVTFLGNVSSIAGGAVHLRAGEATLINALFAGNQAGRGGGIDADGGAIELTNATLTGNVATQSFSSGGALRLHSDSAVTFRNSIIWGNEGGNGLGGEIHSVDTDLTFEYSLFSDEPGAISVGGSGSMQAEHALHLDPEFVDPAQGNFRLSGTSPAIDAGDPNTDPDQFPVDDQQSPVDLDGLPRFAGTHVNMGAYESLLADELLVADPEILDFGTVETGSISAVATVELTSAGLQTIGVDSIDASDSPFDEVGGTCPVPPFQLDTGQSCTLEYVFQPGVEGSFEQNLTIDTTADPVNLTLSGLAFEAGVPEVDVDPDMLQFEVSAGGESSDSMLIANTGDGLLEWQAFTALPSGGAAGARVIDCESAPGLVIQDGGNVDLGFPSFVPDAMIVDHFVPPVYPAGIDAVCLSLVSMMADSIDFEVVILADDGPDGAPGTELGSLAFTASDLPEFGFPPPPDFEPVWYSYDLSPLGLSVESGGVYVGVRWTESEESVMIGIDGSSDHPPGFAGGYMWNPMAEQWAPIESQIPIYRALLVRTAFGEEAAGDCNTMEEVAWLSLAPQSGSVAGGDSSAVLVEVDAGDLTAGHYEALLCVTSNDPDTPLVEVPVALEVTEPEPEAIVEGVVSSLGYCQAAPQEAADALVLIEGDQVTESAITDGNGFYQFELPAEHGPVVMTVSLQSHHTEVIEDVDLVAGQSTTVDVDLVLRTACATMAPEAFNRVLTVGELSEEILAIGNVDGGSGLAWTLASGAGCYDPSLEPWVDVSQTSGTVPAGGVSEVPLTISSNNLEPGVHSTTVCVDTDDAQTPGFNIPIELEVRAPAIFRDRFESGDGR